MLPSSPSISRTSAGDTSSSLHVSSPRGSLFMEPHGVNRSPAASHDSVLEGMELGARRDGSGLLATLTPSTTETVWKQRVKDRDDVVRDLMKRIVALELENETLYAELDAVKRTPPARTIGTNTTFEWVTEQHQRSQLVMLEEYMRLQEYMLYAEWFGLCLAYHRQVFHATRSELQLRQLHRALSGGTLLSTPSGGVTIHNSGDSFPSAEIHGDGRGSTMATTPHKNAGTTFSLTMEASFSPSSSSHMFSSSVGSVTPSSATGTALHLLRGLDAIQAGNTERRIQEIGHTCLMMHRGLRSQLRSVATLHEQLVQCSTEEANARRCISEEAFSTMLTLYRDRFLAALRGSHQQQILFLQRENKRMLEFAIEESAAHHQTRLAHQYLQTECHHEAVTSVVTQEYNARQALQRAEVAGWLQLSQLVWNSTLKSAKASEVLHQHLVRLDAASISIRHAEEPWGRSMVAELEGQCRTQMTNLFLQLEDSRRLALADHQRHERDVFTENVMRCKATSWIENEVLTSSVMQWMRDDVLKHFASVCFSAAQAAHAHDRKILTHVVDIETHQRLLVERGMWSEWTGIKSAIEADRTRLAANGYWREHGDDTLKQCMRDVSVLVHGMRKSAQETVEAIVKQSTSTLGLVFESNTEAAAQEQRHIRAALRVEREEQYDRTEFLLYEQNAFNHRILLPFVVAVRETELNEEYGSAFQSIEDDTRMIIKRSAERENRHVHQFAHEGLLANHKHLGEALLGVHRDWVQSVDTFLSQDVRRSEKRIQEVHHLQLQREVRKMERLVAEQTDTIKGDMVVQLEDTKRSASSFWKEVCAQEGQRRDDMVAQFFIHEVVPWIRQEREQALGHIAAMHRSFQQLQRDDAVDHLKEVFNGPVIEFVRDTHEASLGLVTGYHNAGSRLESSVVTSLASYRSHTRELLELKEARWKQQLTQTESLYVESRRLLEEEAKQHAWQTEIKKMCIDELAHRAQIMDTQNQELLWIVYRQLSMRRYLHSTSDVAPSSLPSTFLASGGATLPSYPTTASNNSVTSRMLDTLRRASLAPADGDDADASLGAHALSRASSVASSAWETTRSPPNTQTSLLHQPARARVSSMILTRSAERQRALREESPPVGSSRYFTSAVASASSGEGMHTGSASPVRTGGVAFSPSPNTRERLQSDHQRRILERMDTI